MIQDYKISKTRSIQLGLLSLAVILFVYNSPIQNFIEKNLTHKVNFQMRSFLKKDPKFNSKIKVIINDDKTVAYNKVPFLSFDDWHELLHAMRKNEPGLILIDKIFGFVVSNEEGYTDFVKELDTTPLKIATGCFISDTETGGRDPLETDSPRFDIDTYLNASSSLEDVSWYPQMRGNLYGASKDIAKSLKYPGHIVYDDSYKVIPFYRTSETTVVPHLTLNAAEKIRLSKQGFYVNDEKVSIDKEGKVLVNLAHPDHYFENVYSMKSMLEYVRNGWDIPIVEKGDVLVVLPAMFTGNTDWVNTPHGMIPGGFILLAMINSVLSNDWITVPNNQYIILVAFAVVGFLLGYFISQTLYIVLAFIGIFSIVLGGIALFCYYSIFVPWLLMSCSFALPGFLLYFLKLRNSQLYQIHLQSEIQLTNALQQTFFPKQSELNLGTLKLCSYLRVAEQCSGDWWGFLELDEDRFCVFVVDAMGHGAPAAMATAVAYASCNSVFNIGTKENYSDGAFYLNALNKMILDSMDKKMTLTMVVAIFDIKKGEVQISNAGHVPVFMQSKNKPKPKSIRIPGNPVGVSEERYDGAQTKTIKFKSGDRFFLYSDGLIEIKNKAGRNYGRKNLARALEKHDHLTQMDSIKAVVNEAISYGGEAAVDDDILVVTVQT